MMVHRTLAFVLAAGCAAPRPAAAQDRFGPSADLSVGVFVGSGGSFAERGGPALDGVVAVALGRTGSGTLMAGVTGGISGPLMIGDQGCLVGPDDTCLPDYPTFVTLGAVAGVQRTIGSGLSARALAGPTYFQAADGDDTVGLQGRLDVAKPLVFRTALVASLRASLLPRYQGETLSYATFGLGLRIQ